MRRRILFSTLALAFAAALATVSAQTPVSAPDRRRIQAGAELADAAGR